MLIPVPQSTAPKKTRKHGFPHKVIPTMALQNLSFLTAHACRVATTVKLVLQKRFVQPVPQGSTCRMEVV